MIKFSLPFLLLIPMVFTLVMLMAGWLYYAIRQGKTIRRPTRSRIYRCLGCGHVYVDERDVPLARCPRCSGMNEAVRR
ncbi:MAG: hypothetical protein V2A34_11280 [Lentisphaerota bacterium]